MNANALEKYRLKRKLTVTEVARRMGKTVGWYSKIKSGELVLKSQYIAPMADILGVKPEKLAKEYFSKPELEDTSSSEGEDA